MRLGLAFKLFVKSLGHQRRRALLTVVTVAWGTLSMVFLLGLGEGARRRGEEDFLNFGQAFAVIWQGKTSKPWQGWPSGRWLRFWAQDMPFLEARLGPDVLVCGQTGRPNILLENGPRQASVFLRGVGPVFGYLRNQVPMPGGRHLSTRDESERRRAIFLGDELAVELFEDEDPVGRNLLVAGQPYTVVGVLRHKMPWAFGDESPDTRLAAVPLSTFLVQFGDKPLRGIFIKPPAPKDMPVTLKKAKEALSALYKFDPEDDMALRVWDRAEDAQDMRNMFTGVLIFLGIIGGLTLFIGGVSVANILFTIVKERTREIGVQMALGARRRDILLPIVMEGLLYTLTGGFLGMGLGAALVKLLASFPTENYKTLSMLGHPTVSWNIALASVVILCVVGTLAGFFPARRAASVQPAETLRYE
jgi:putative ABC transport system permease protein